MKTRLVPAPALRADAWHVEQTYDGITWDVTATVFGATLAEAEAEWRALNKRNQRRYR